MIEQSPNFLSPQKKSHTHNYTSIHSSNLSEGENDNLGQVNENSSSTSLPSFSTTISEDFNNQNPFVNRFQKIPPPLFPPPPSPSLSSSILSSPSYVSPSHTP
jgi:hypothetical protein